MKKVIGAFLLVMIFLFGVAGMSSALTYQDGTNVQFTFDSTLSISLSDADIIIGNLIPGQDDVSNTVDITVNTNNLCGYTLSATVGNTTKNHRDLRHANGVANFASLAVDANLASLTDESTSVWGYSISNDGTTWSNYNGLPKYDDTQNIAELNATDGAATNSTTSFRIGAYAAEGQLAGDYSNVINFKVVSNIAKTYIQDVTASTCPTERTLVYDKRDEKPYYIQQITTGNTTLCWMTTNLDLAGGTALYSDTSNVPDGYTIAGGSPYYTLPTSSMIGFRNNDVAYVYNSGSEVCSLSSPCYSYYSFPAATAGTNPESSPAIYDICPRGWRLPSIAEYTSLKNVFANDVAFMSQPWYGVRAGRMTDDYYSYIGEYGLYWTSGGTNSVSASYLYYDSSNSAVYSSYRSFGHAVRCVAK